MNPSQAMHEQSNGSGLQLSTILKFDNISFDMKGLVSVAPGSIIGKGEGVLKTPAAIHVDLSNVEMHVDVLVAIDWNIFEKLELGQMLNPSCLLSSLAVLNVTKLDLVSVLTPNSPPTVTFMSPGIDELFNQLIHIVDGLYSQVLRKISNKMLLEDRSDVD